jgi:hypothetical protein
MIETLGSLGFEPLYVVGAMLELLLLLPFPPNAPVRLLRLLRLVMQQ